MAGKILIFGATGSVGSSLTKLYSNESDKIHLIGKNDEEVGNLSKEVNCSFSVADVTDQNFIEKISDDLKNEDINGIIKKKIQIYIAILKFSLTQIFGKKSVS